MNYHRVAVQLLTWGIQLARLNHDKFDAQVGELEVEGLPFDGITVPYPEGN